MPLKLMPGTPSIWYGSRMPCQWMDVSTFRWFVTRNVTVSPARQRKVGAGMEPLMVVARRGRPV